MKFSPPLKDFIDTSKDETREIHLEKKNMKL